MTDVEIGVSVLSGDRAPLELQAELEVEPESDNRDDDDDDDDAKGKPHSELEVRYSNIVDILDTLNKLAFKIRDPTAHQMPGAAILRRAMRHAVDPEFLSKLSLMDHQIVCELVSSLRNAPTDDQLESDFLINRLAKALTQRRIRFQYWERHAEKLMVDVFETFNLAYTDQPVDLDLDEDAQSLTGNTSASQGATVLSGTEASTYHNQADAMSETSSIVTSLSILLRDDGEDIALPRPPEDALQGKDFVCPYCRILCPAKEGSGSRWK